MRTLALVSLLALAGGLSAQKASYTFFGDTKACSRIGCYKQKAPTLVVQGRPKLGASIVLQTEPPFGAPFGGCAYYPMLVTGVSRTAWGGQRLPWNANKLTFQIGYVVYTFCGHVQVSADLITPVPPSRNRYSDVTIRIPNDVNLLGQSFFNQVWGRDVSGTWGSRVYWRMSRGGHGVIGR